MQAKHLVVYINITLTGIKHGKKTTEKMNEVMYPKISVQIGMCQGAQ